MKLGDKVHDHITGFEGVITARCEYITGCTQMCVQPPAKDGAFVDAKWFDDDRLSVVAADWFTHAVTTAGAGDPAPIK